MTYIFNKESYSIRELLGKYPSCDDIVDENLEGTFKERLIWYHAASETPKSYPCIKDERWEDGKEYKDSEIDIVNESNVIWTDKTKNKIYDWDEYQAARLKPKEESQEEMLGEIIRFIKWNYDGSNVGFKKVLEYLQTKFTITRK